MLTSRYFASILRAEAESLVRTRDAAEKRMQAAHEHFEEILAGGNGPAALAAFRAYERLHRLYLEAEERAELALIELEANTTSAQI